MINDINTIHCMIVDDEPLAQQVLERHCRRYAEEMGGRLRLVKKCNNAVEAFAVLHTERIDLVFLDIKMPAIGGIEFIQSISVPPAFIFTTAFSGYAVQSYELEAFDYLLKPIEYERFAKSVNRFWQGFLLAENGKGAVANRDADANEDAAIQGVAVHQGLSVHQQEYLYLKTEGKLVRILHRDIVYAEALKDYIRIRTITGSLLTHMTMKALAEVLPAGSFFRVHRSFIINSLHVDGVGRTAVMLGTTEIPVGESYKSALPGILERMRGR